MKKMLDLILKERLHIPFTYMGFQHCIALWKYLRWIPQTYITQRKYLQNAVQCGKRMCKQDVATWFKTLEKLYFTVCLVTCLRDEI